MLWDYWPMPRKTLGLAITMHQTEGNGRLWCSWAVLEGAGGSGGGRAEGGEARGGREVPCIQSTRWLLLPQTVSPSSQAQIRS